MKILSAIKSLFVKEAKADELYKDNTIVPEYGLTNEQLVNLDARVQQRVDELLETKRIEIEKKNKEMEPTIFCNVPYYERVN